MIKILNSFLFNKLFLLFILFLIKYNNIFESMLNFLLSLFFILLNLISFSLVIILSIYSIILIIFFEIIFLLYNF